ncbi:DUF2726 domain-containing protein [Neisseriaceae bacterium B1]
MFKTYFTILILLAIFSLLLYALFHLKKRNPFTDGTPLPYFRRPLMTQTELAVYDVLLEALPEYMIFPQVQASRVLEVPKSRETYYWFNFVSRLSYDFVVCRLDGVPLAAIEIDDATHALPERQEADNRKNKATEAAGVAMIRWKVGQTPNVREIRRLIQKIDKKAA